ncbi:MAG TPA: response regulator [Dehalococcoidia bacterium]|nr:response regulator [Dehalococcoidia bacterium]
MPKVLVAEDAADLRFLLVETLVDAGYEVIQAANGTAALEGAKAELPDVILMDVWMPVMDGFEALRKLRQDPATRGIPVIMLTSLSAMEGEKLGMDLGVAHYLTKPLDYRVLDATIRVVLRERLAPADEPVQERRAIRTADRLIALEQKLGGGLPLNSLTLMEGAASAGKSVLCQHLAFGALEGGFDTAYFTSEHSKESLVKQMNSLALDVAEHLYGERLKVLSVPAPKKGEAGGPLLEGLAETMEALPARYKFIEVDTITGLASAGGESAVIAFFTACRGMCNQGRTVVAVIHSYAFGSEMFTRLHDLCDGHLRVRSETVGGKAVKTVEVRKINSSDLDDNNMVSFEVVPNMGMKVLPISRTKA